VVGARGSGGVTRLLLGSVAEGAVNQAPMSVLVVRSPELQGAGRLVVGNPAPGEGRRA